MTKKTLKEFLETDCGLDSSSDAQFMVKDGCNDMLVSYRYLDCPAWRYLLDKQVTQSIENTIYGQMVCFTVVD